MKHWLLLLIPAIINAQDFTTLLKLSQNNLQLQAKSQEVKAKKALYKLEQSKNYPTLDAKLSAIYLKDTPSMNFNLPFAGMPPKIEVGKRPNYTGEVGLSYPLFTGFAISNLIEKAKLDFEKTKLEKKDAKRKLYMNIASLYGSLYALNHAITANKDAYKAIDDAWKKASGFYKAGLLSPADLANIKAKKYEITANQKGLENQRENIKKLLSYITTTTINNKTILPKIKLPTKETLIQEALNKRADILALQKMLNMDESDIKLAKSTYMPNIALIGALKLQGDTLKLNGDGFTNPNKSYIGASMEWKLFDGFTTKHRTDAAKAKKMARILLLKDYQKNIQTTLENQINTLHTLILQKEAKKAQFDATQSYYKLTYGRFSNHLASSDELSRSIASKATAKAQLEKIISEIFTQKCKILLESSLKEFEENLSL